MATLTLTKVRQILRDDFDEPSQAHLTDAELNRIVGRGYIDTAVKALCYEKRIPKTNLPADVPLVSLMGDGIVQIGYVGYTPSGAGHIGRLRILPHAAGWINLEAGSPQGWFRWGEMLVLEPPPDVATYDIALFAACYPTTKVGIEVGSLSLVQGTRYRIQVPGTTPWTDIGAETGTEGEEFVAEAAVAGTGTAIAVSFDGVPAGMHECILDFSRFLAATKIKQWADATSAYNRYIVAVQRKRWEFIHKSPDAEAARQIPDNVLMEMPQ